jgi:signal transduction protein with GAF and PtsI domain
VQGEKRKFIEGFSRSREKSSEKDGEVTAELKVQEKLMRELEEESKREQSGELEKLEKSIRSLEIEIAKANNKNEEIEAKLQSYPFFNEWKMMCTEAEGARKMDGALRKELKKRKDRLKEVKENGLPKKELSEEKRKPPIIMDE